MQENVKVSKDDSMGALPRRGARECRALDCFIGPPRRICAQELAAILGGEDILRLNLIPSDREALALAGMFCIQDELDRK